MVYIEEEKEVEHLTQAEIEFYGDQAEKKNNRLTIICITLVCALFIACIFGLWAYTVHTPDATALAAGSKFSCVVEY